MFGKDGLTRSLYSEDGPNPDLIGPASKVRKISDVRFDIKRQEWVSVDRKTKRVIARDKSRKACVLKEHAHYEKEIQRGRYPWT